MPLLSTGLAPAQLHPHPTSPAKPRPSLHHTLPAFPCAPLCGSQTRIQHLEEQVAVAGDELSKADEAAARTLHQRQELMEHRKQLQRRMAAALCVQRAWRQWKARALKEQVRKDGAVSEEGGGGERGGGGTDEVAPR